MRLYSYRLTPRQQIDLSTIPSDVLITAALGAIDLAITIAVLGQTSSTNWAAAVVFSALHGTIGGNKGSNNNGDIAVKLSLQCTCLQYLQVCLRDLIIYIQ